MQTLDVRELVCAQRHALIFDTFDSLAEGEGFELVNDHDPRPIYFQLQKRHGSSFRWDYLEQGPDVWRIAVVRGLNQFQADDSIQIQTNS